MPYCTRSDVELVYGPLNVKDWADIDGNDDPTYIASRIDWAISKADNLIEGWLRRRNFAVPLVTTPGIIKDISADLAGYNLYSARMLDGGDRTSDNLSHKYKEAMKNLGDIVAGNIMLELDLDDHTDAPFVATS